MEEVDVLTINIIHPEARSFASDLGNQYMGETILRGRVGLLSYLKRLRAWFYLEKWWFGVPSEMSLSLTCNVRA